MEAAVIVGIVAAGVSLASVAANLYIAKKTRESSADSLRLKARLDRDDAAIKAIKEIEVEGERLRIQCWDVINQLQSFGRKPASRSSSASEAVLTKEFLRQAKLFLDKWATVKGDLPDTEVERLGRVRHECRHLLEDLRLLSEHGVPDSPEDLDVLISKLQELLAQVNSFTRIVTNVRRGLWQ